MSAVMDTYLDALCARLLALKHNASQAMTAAGDAIVETVGKDGLVYVFGTGHSHMLAEEVHYRAGGPAFTVPILATATMLHEGAIASTAMERTHGVVKPIFDRYPITADDVLIVASNSGTNAAPLEAAHLGREIGCTVIAITSLAYSTASAGGGEKLADSADIIIDNGTPPGDGIVDLPGTELKSGPASTVIGVAIMNAIFSDVASRLARESEPPIYLSANMPGAKDRNKALVKRYAKRNRHL